MIQTAFVEEMESLTGLNNKVFPVNAPERTPAPYLAYDWSSGVNTKTLDGFLESKRVTAEVNIICSSAKALKTLEAEVVQHLQSFLGRAIGVSAPVFVEDITVMEPVQMYEYELKMYRSNIEFIVNY